MSKGTKNPAESAEAKIRSAREILDPALRSWIKNVIVPNLVREYVAVRKQNNSNPRPAHFLDSRTRLVRDFAQQHVDTLGGLA